MKKTSPFEIKITKYTDTHGETVNLISFPLDTEKKLHDKLIVPLEKILGTDVKRDISTDHFQGGKIHTESFWWRFYPKEVKDFSFEKYLLRDFVKGLLNSDFTYSVDYEHGSNVRVHFHFGYSETGERKLRKDERVKKLIEKVKTKKKEKKRLKEEKEDLEVKRIVELEDKRLLNMENRIKNLKKTSISTDKLYHISINESFHGEHYCSEYIINERLLELINLTIGDGFDTGEEGVDITGRYGFIRYKIGKDDIKVFSTDRKELEEKYNGEDYGYDTLLECMKFDKVSFINDHRRENIRERQLNELLR